MSTAYLYFSFSALFNALVSTFLGLFIYSRDRHNKVNQSFALFCLGVAAWSYPYVFWPVATTSQGTLAAFQLLHIGACFVSIFYLNFVVQWLGLYEKKKSIINSGYWLALFFVCVIPTSFFIKDMIPKFSMRYWAEPGILYYVYLIMFFGYFLYASYLLLKEYLRGSIEKQPQLRLMLVGMVITFLGGSTNYFLWFNINIPPYGNILASTFVIATAYAMLRYRFMDTRVIATEFFTGALWVFILFRVLSSSTITDATINSFLLISTLVIGIFLIRSVRKEIEQRGHIEKLATDLAHSNDQLLATNEKLKELDKQKTEFVSIASHQLRSPLTAIKGYTSMLLEGSFGPVEDKAREAIDRVYESSLKLVTVIEDFLNITRIELGRMKYELSVFDLGQLTQTVVKDQEPNVKKRGLTIEFQDGTGNHQISADSGKVTQVVSNIIDNSIKYTPNGGVKIKVENVPAGKSKANSPRGSKATLRGENVRITVSDSGVGIPKEVLPKLFEKFVRADDAGKTNISGTGLGLYVAKQIVEGLGGKIWAESEGKNKGSTFFIEFPRSSEKVSAVKSQVESYTKADLGKLQNGKK